MIPANYDVRNGPSTSVEAIRSELARYGSPLLPFAQTIYDLGVQYDVDPAFFMGTVKGENWYGTYPGNGAFDVDTGSGTFNWASISNAAYGGHAVAGSRWGQYPDAQTGIAAFFRLLTAEYYPLGQTTLESIWWGLGGSCSPCVDGQHAYGPCSDNHGDCSSLQTAIDVMNRLQASQPAPGPNPGPGPIPGPADCPPGSVFDPGQRLCIPTGDAVYEIPSFPAAAAVAGLVLLAGAAIVAGRAL